MNWRRRLERISSTVLRYLPKHLKTQPENHKYSKSDAPSDGLQREINGKKYTVLTSRVAPFTPVRLENGEWAGVIYHYGKAKFAEENDCLRLRFEYYVLENQDKIDPADSDRFLQYIGDILVDILDRNLNEDASTIPILSQNEMGYLAD